MNIGPAHLILLDVCQKNLIHLLLKMEVARELILACLVLDWARALAIELTKMVVLILSHRVLLLTFNLGRF